MPDIFKAGIAAQVNAALGSLLFPTTLIKVRSSVRGNITAGLGEVRTEYATRGFLSSYRDNLIDGTRILAGDRKAVLLGQPLPVAPAPGDTIQLEGKDWSVISVTRDPAGATYSCQVR